MATFRVSVFFESLSNISHAIKNSPPVLRFSPLEKVLSWGGFCLTYVVTGGFVT